jgi:YgiT-type zinc finger domain-containing protein
MEADLLPEQMRKTVMICTNCYKAKYITAKTVLKLNIAGQDLVLHDLPCETCPACGEITFTQAQSLEIDKQRIALEFGAKPLLTPLQLKNLRRFLAMSLDEICLLLHIGRNSYGRWERGDIAITPSMNLLVHNLIEKIPAAPVNVLDRERVAAIEKANASLATHDLSLGSYLQKAIGSTKLNPEVVSASIGLGVAEFVKITNDEVLPQKIPHEVTAKIAHYFHLPFDVLVSQLNALQKIPLMEGSSAVHDLSGPYAGTMPAGKVSSGMKKAAREREAELYDSRVSEEYLAKVRSALERLNGSPE